MEPGGWFRKALVSSLCVSLSFTSSPFFPAPTRAQYGTNQTLGVWLNLEETPPTSPVTVRAAMVNTSDAKVAALTRSVIELSAVSHNELTPPFQPGNKARVAYVGRACPRGAVVNLPAAHRCPRIGQ